MKDHPSSLKFALTFMYKIRSSLTPSKEGLKTLNIHLETTRI